MPEKTNDLQIAHLERGLIIDRHELDQALIQQPGMFFKVCEEYGLAVSRRDKLKDELKKVRAQLYFEFKQDESSGKLSEAALTALIDKSKVYLTAAEDHNKACLNVDLLQGLKEAFQQRSYILKDLSALWVAGYWTNSSVRGRESQEVQESRNNERREQIDTARKKLTR